MSYVSESKEDVCSKCQAGLHKHGERIGTTVLPTEGMDGTAEACEVVLIQCQNCYEIKQDLYIDTGQTWEGYNAIAS